MAYGNVIEDIYALYEFFRADGFVSLYGAGWVAKLILHWEQRRHVGRGISEIIVTDVTNNPSSLSFIPVISVSEYQDSEKKKILVAVEDKWREEIQRELAGINIENYWYLSSDCISLLRQEPYRIVEQQEIMAQTLEIVEVHKDTFGPYLGRHTGEDMAVIGTGPSLAKYHPMKSVYHIGLNCAYKFQGIKFDYYFLQDKTSSAKISDIASLDCELFLGKFQEWTMFETFRGITHYSSIPEGIAVSTKAKRYFLQPSDFGVIHRDIRYYPLYDRHSVVFSALQFALFCNPKHIYLVGCDCTQAGYFDGKENHLAVDDVYYGYLKIKEFASYHYPDTEIVSLNPVGLKGMFTDKFLD